MPGRKSELDVDIYAIAAARMRSDGYSQQQIASRLNVKQPEVSRYLERAKSNRWLEERPPLFLETRISTEILDTIDSLFFAASDVHEFMVRQFPLGGQRLRQVTRLTYDPRRKQNDTLRLSTSAIEAIRAILSQANYCGVTWGRTIDNLVRQLLEIAETAGPLAKKPVRFVPLCGEPLFYQTEPERYSSSRLAVRLNDVFNGPDARLTLPSLTGVPASIPLEFDQNSQGEAIKRFISRIQGYEEIFGRDGRTRNNPPLIDRLDTIITSIGVPDPSRRGVFLDERVRACDITEQDIENMVVGDLGGIIIPKRTLSDAQNDLLNRIATNWNGVQLSDVERCASEASDKRPGVIVLSLGRHRINVVMECIFHGLINHLIIDDDFYEAATEILASQT